MHDTTTTRPDGACLLHRPPAQGHPWMRADPSYTTCSGCLDRLRDTLRDVVTRYARLDATPGSSGDSGGRGAPGFRSQPTASLHIVAMRDPRSATGARVWVAADGRVHHESEHPPRSVRNVLETVAVDIAEHRGITPPERITVPDLGRWIDAQLDYVTRHDLVVDVADELRALAAQLRPVTGDARPFIGLCPNTLDEGDTRRPCEARLHAPTGGTDTIHCHGCGRRWERPEWEHLGRMIQQERAETLAS